MTSNPSETIELITPRADVGSKWLPSEGEEALRFRDHLSSIGISDNDADSIMREAASVLSRCLPPTTATGKETGLVIGYVQSGKTMSFTAISALARDNGFKLIIVITGVTRNLFQQSTDRLKNDLGIGVRTDRKWQFFDNPKARPDLRQRIAAALASNIQMPAIGNQTVLITVMKNRTHLINLINLLSQINLSGLPALIIDDEADQASLNNQVRKKSESATYRRIVMLRGLLPQHTFLQYTATPQALLLINLIDTLSPSFAEILTPGPAYTGGKVFFEDRFDLIQSIPDRDIPSSRQSLMEPPRSLLEAMRIFFVGVAAGLSKDGGEGNNRSMMIHPSKETMPHANYVHWARQVQHHWNETLSLASGDPDYLDLIEEFRKVYAQLRLTAHDIPSFETVLRYLRTGIQTTNIVEVNTSKGPTPQIDWEQNYAHILVGGEVLNRGVTVKGLTVTYMPRSKGVGNADTIEQRARWFGYKADYLGYCRVYLSDQNQRIYRSYVRHEENIRKQLNEHRLTGRSLRDWRRAFFLSPELRPTRSDVLDLDYARGNFSDSWFQPSAPHLSQDAVAFNQELITQLRTKLPFNQDVGHPERTDHQKHLVSANINLKQMFDKLLTRFRMTNQGDAQRFTGLLLQVAAYLENNPHEACSIYIMSSGLSRNRSLNDENEIVKLFEGAYPDEPAERVGEIYPGDANIKAKNSLTIQVHILNVTRGVGSKRQVLGQNVPALAIWIPRQMSSPWLVQDEATLQDKP